MGWVWSRILGGIGDTWVITRPFPGRREHIASRLAEVPEGDRIHMVYVDVPRWMHRIGSKTGSALFGLLEYVVWQVLALRATRKLQRRVGFDFVWHLVYANAWIGSLAAFVGPPFVYGPVGAGVSPPRGLLQSLGPSGLAFECFRLVARLAGRYLNPVAGASWRRARLVLAQNPETLDWLPRAERGKGVVFTNAVLEESVPEPSVERTRHRTPTALCGARLIPWKGLALAIRAMALLPEWRLVICGQGPDERRLRRLARRLGVEDRVRFHGLVPRPEVLRMMREEADVLLFPSLHDEGNWTALEAVACGLPVVALDRGAPRLLATEVVTTVDVESTVRGLALAVRKAVANPRVVELMTIGIARQRCVELLMAVGLLATAAVP